MTEFLDLDALLSGSYTEPPEPPFLYEDPYAPHGPHPIQPENKPSIELSGNRSESVKTETQSPQPPNQAPTYLAERTRLLKNPISKPRLDLGLYLSLKEKPNQYFSDHAIFIRGPLGTKNDQITFHFKNPKAFENGRLWFSLDTLSGTPIRSCEVHKKPEQQEFVSMIYGESKVKNGHIIDGKNHPYSLSFICSNNCLNLTSEDRLRIILEVDLPDRLYFFEKELFICYRPEKKYKAITLIRKRPLELTNDTTLEFHEAAINGVQRCQLTRELGVKVNKILKAVLEF